MSVQQVQVDYPAQLVVRLLDASGDPVLGVTYSQLTATYKKQGDGSWTSKSVLDSEWVPVSEGRYLLLFSADELDTAGKFVFRVEVTGAETYIGDIDVVTDWATAVDMLQDLLDGLIGKVSGEDLSAYKKIQDQALQDINAKHVLQDAKIDRLATQVSALLRKVEAL